MHLTSLLALAGPCCGRATSLWSAPRPASSSHRPRAGRTGPSQPAAMRWTPLMEDLRARLQHRGQRAPWTQRWLRRCRAGLPRCSAGPAASLGRSCWRSRGGASTLRRRVAHLAPQRRRRRCPCRRNAAASQPVHNRTLRLLCAQGGVLKLLWHVTVWLLNGLPNA